MLKLIDNLNELKTLKLQWCDFAVVKKYPLLSFEWIYNCYKSFYQEKSIRLFYYETKGEITAIAPLVSVKKSGIECYEFAGASFLYEPAGFLYKNENDFKSLITEIIKIKIPIILQRIYNKFDTIKWDNSLIRFPGLLINRQVAGTPTISTSMGWEEYYNSISSKRKYDIRRAQKRANEFGKTNLEIISPSEEQFKTLSQRAFAIESSGWKKKTGSGILVNEYLNKFFSDYLYQACLKNLLRLAFLKINENYIATMICLAYANKLWILKIGYDEQYGRCSPGMLLLFLTIKHTFDNNFLTVELLGTDENWTRVWSTFVHEYYTTVIYPFSYNGYGHLLLDGFSWVRNKIKYF